jgi:ABC-type sugar transport system ATPase subunit
MQSKTHSINLDSEMKENGRIVEMGSPKELLENVHSHFSAMIEQSGAASLLREIVKKKTEQKQQQQQLPQQS